MEPMQWLTLIVFGLTIPTFLASGPMWKSLLLAAVGIFLGCIGIDVTSGTARFTFGLVVLQDGIGIVPRPRPGGRHPDRAHRARQRASL